MSIYDEIGASIGRKKPAPTPEPAKWLDGTPKDQPRVRDHAGNAFDKVRFYEDPEYRVLNHPAYIRMRHLEDEMRRDAENTEANARHRAELQERQDTRIRRVAEEQIAQETRREAAEEREEKIAARVEQLRPSLTPRVES